MAGVLNISGDGELRILSNVEKRCFDRHGNGKSDRVKTVVFHKFPLSVTRNKFVCIGCATDGYLSGNSISTSCSSFCDTEDDVIDGSCAGFTGCSQSNIPTGISSFLIFLESDNDTYFNHSDPSMLSFNPCDRAFVIEETSFNFSKTYLRNFTTRVPAVLDWAIGKDKCNDAMENLTTYACKSNSYCHESDNGPGYRCNCSTGYKGNPYLTGCQDIDECADPKLNICKNKCINTIGSFSCEADTTYTPLIGHEQSNESIAIKLIVGFGVSLIVLVICGSWLYMGFKKRRLIQLEHKFFMQNGGLMLQQQLPKLQGYNETTKIFTAEELEKATDKYNNSRIIGQGGFGTVYKGNLTDDRVIAIKKSKLMDQSQIEQFINEVVVLSQINHRNVVRLLGCCLETEVPLLVYEFVSNGTLFDHIHDKRKALAMSWETRIKIAAETAGVLSYLHSAASVPIIHRDIKSTNILLDDNYVAKVSDFGASRLIPIDQTELATLVQGTLGYLDPEYLLTSQLTEKSDVYSFGVVLIELITGKKALCFKRPEAERSLANYFFAALREGRLFEVVGDYNKEEDSDEINEVAHLAAKCVRVNGEIRPSMKEVAMELERLMKNHTHVDVETVIEEETKYLTEDDAGTSDKFSIGGICDTSIVYGR